MNSEKKKVAFHTLGCKLNFAETSTISRSFPEDRFIKVPASTKADIYVINTCSVTDVADKKCRQAIKKFINMSPDAFIAVVGCYAQLNPQEISAIPGVDLVLGSNEKFDISTYLENTGKKSVTEIHSCNTGNDKNFYPSYSVGDRTRSFLKVQDGCDYGCSYCTIPLARGQSRNPAIDSIIAEAEKIAERGIKELVLTGVNIGDFGKTTGDSFINLLRKLVKVEGIMRYRISSIEPNLLTDEIISFAAENGKILPHFHIPLQSGNDKVLGLMRRRYKRSLFADKVAEILTKIPYAGIGADVITGFPGETGDDFEDTYTFLSELPVSYLHVFPYSERPNTVAENLPSKVILHEKETRSKKLIDLSHRKSDIFHKYNIGQVAEVLFEKTRSNGMISGFTGNYIKVEYPSEPRLPGQLRKVKITGVAEDGTVNIDLI